MGWGSRSRYGGAAPPGARWAADASPAEDTNLRSSAAALPFQVPDEEKRRRADFVIDTGCSVDDTRGQVAALVERLLAAGPGGAYARAMEVAAAAAAQSTGGDAAAEAAAS